MLLELASTIMSWTPALYFPAYVHTWTDSHVIVFGSSYIVLQVKMHVSTWNIAPIHTCYMESLASFSRPPHQWRAQRAANLDHARGRCRSEPLATEFWTTFFEGWFIHSGALVVSWMCIYIYIYIKKKAQRFLVTTIRGECAPATVSDGTEHQKKSP